MNDRPLKPSLDALLKAAFTYERPSDPTMLSRTGPRRAPGEYAGMGVGLDGAGQAGMIQGAVRQLPRHVREAIQARYMPRGVKCRCGARCCKGWVDNTARREALDVLADTGVSAALSGSLTTYRARRECVERFFGKKVNLGALAKAMGKDAHTIGEWNKKIGAELERLLATGYDELADRLADCLPVDRPAKAM